MLALTDPILQAPTALAGVSLLTTAAYGRWRWTAHAAKGMTRVLAVLGCSALAFAVVVPSVPHYQLVWLYTLLAVPSAFALFGFEYYGIDAFDRRDRRAAFLALPALGALAGTLLSLDADSVGAGGRMLTPAVRGEMGEMGSATAMQAPLAGLLGRQITLPPWGVDLALAVQDLAVYYTSGVTLVAAGLLVASVVRYRHLDTGLGVSLAFVGLWPWAVYGFMPVVATLASWEGALTAVGGGYVASTVATGTAVRRYGLFESEPAAGNVGATTVLDEMGDPVFVLDREGTVLRLNAAAETTFGVDDTETVGRPLSAAVGVDPDDLDESVPVGIETTAGRRQFETTRSAVEGRGECVRGETVVFRDVTRRQTRQQRLQVLSRVLRHNLRNEMTVIRGRARMISDGGATDPAESADTIREVSDRLIDISERAREAQEVIAADRTDEAETDVETVVSAVHGQIAEQYPEVELSTAVSGTPVAAVDPDTLEIVVQNVVENACRHNDAASPLVVTSVERTTDGMIRLVTRDNGPGVPEGERLAVENGVEDPLEHGSGMGLWTVKWGATQMGGTVSFDDATPRGTAVQLCVPAVRDGVTTP